jgi:hypothetical protein
MRPRFRLDGFIGAPTFLFIKKESVLALPRKRGENALYKDISSIRTPRRPSRRDTDLAVDSTERVIVHCV